MEGKTAIQRMQQLVRELNEASETYYNGQSELMTDYEWDARFDELKRLETETGTTLPDSPTQKVSEDTISGQKEEHEFAALSLAKTKQTPHLDIVETRRTDARRHLRWRSFTEGGNPW